MVARYARTAAVLLATTFATTLTITTANAAIVTLDALTVDWTDVSPGSVAVAGNGTQSASLRWGTPTSGNTGQSGYDFEAVSVAPSVDVPPSPSVQFDLGTFSHVNVPILSSSSTLSSASLDLGANIFVDGVDLGRRNFVVDVFHNETSNGGSTCANGQSNNQGVNINGCADIVTFAFNDATENFLVGSDNYTLSVLGFRVGGILGADFQTIEQQTNTATLVAQLQLDNSRPPTVPPGTTPMQPTMPPTTPPTGVSEPGNLVLLGLGLIGVFALRRRHSS